MYFNLFKNHILVHNAFIMFLMLKNIETIKQSIILYQHPGVVVIVIVW
jgi:hypothetical protein